MHTSRVDVSPLKHWSAIAPLALSFAALAVVVVQFVMYGIVHEADEGTQATSFNCSWFCNCR
jgi:glucose uptake protein GlcU